MYIYIYIYIHMYAHLFLHVYSWIHTDTRAHVLGVLYACGVASGKDKDHRGDSGDCCHDVVVLLMLMMVVETVGGEGDH